MSLKDTKVERVLLAGLTAAEARAKGTYVLLAKEIFIETDTYKMKLGNGRTMYKDLPYLPYSTITSTILSYYNQAVLDGRSWTNSAAFNITITDITNWNALVGGGVSEDDAIAYAVSL